MRLPLPKKSGTYVFHIFRHTSLNELFARKIHTNNQQRTIGARFLFKGVYISENMDKTKFISY